MYFVKCVKAGISRHGGKVNVALEGPRDVYEGLFQNGTSKSCSNFFF